MALASLTDLLVALVHLHYSALNLSLIVVGTSAPLYVSGPNGHSIDSCDSKRTCERGLARDGRRSHAPCKAANAAAGCHCAARHVRDIVACRMSDGIGDAARALAPHIAARRAEL